MFQVCFVMIQLLSLATGILYKANISEAPTETEYNRGQTTSSVTSTSHLSAISNNNKLQKLNLQNKFDKIITLKNDNQNMIYVTPISPPPQANNVNGETRARYKSIVVSDGVTSRFAERNWNHNQYVNTINVSSNHYDKIPTKLLLQKNNRNNSGINNNYGNVNGNKNKYKNNNLSNTKNNNTYNYDDKRADNNYVIKNDTNLSFSHNYPIIDYNYKDDDAHDYTVNDYHKNTNADILYQHQQQQKQQQEQQEQQHRIYDNIKLGGIYDYHPPPNPFLQVLFSRYGRHLPNSWYSSSTRRNYGFYAYGAGNDINNNLPNGGYKIEMEFDSNK